MADLTRAFRVPVGAMEAGASLLSGAVAEPVAGWAGILSGGNADKVASTREALTYQPRTEAGKESMAGIADIMGAIKDAAMRSPVGTAVNGFNAMADRAGAVSPALGAAVKTVPAAAAMLLGPGGTATRQAVANVAKGTGQGVARGVAAAAENAAAVPAVRGPLANQDGIFAGHLAKNAPTWKLEQAKTLEARGLSDREIYAQTGWFKGMPDEQWRFEISDHNAAARDYPFSPDQAYADARFKASIGDEQLAEKVKKMEPYAGMTQEQLEAEFKRTGGEIVAAAQSGNKELALQLMRDREGLDAMFDAMRDRKYGPLSAYVDHPELGEAYPDVYQLHTRIDPELGPLGQYAPERPGVGEQFVLRQRPSNWSDSLSTALHETQHAIQAREGFAPGGNSSAMAHVSANPRIDEINRLLSTDIDIQTYDGLMAEKRALLAQEPDPYEKYRRMAGEAEARLVEARRKMTPEERAASYPLDMLDVPVDQLIVRPR